MNFQLAEKAGNDNDFKRERREKVKRNKKIKLKTLRAIERCLALTNLRFKHLGIKLRLNMKTSVLSSVSKYAAKSSLCPFPMSCCREFLHFVRSADHTKSPYVVNSDKMPTSNFQIMLSPKSSK